MADQGITLYVMRLAHMYNKHPEQITLTCSKCQELVGVYPSGQNILSQFPGKVSLVCDVCAPPDAIGGTPAPGAVQEAFGFIRKQ